MKTAKVIELTLYNFLELFPSPKYNGSHVLSAGKHGGGGRETSREPFRPRNIGNFFCFCDSEFSLPDISIRTGETN
jgi:hypothetical protein